jgi:hypothetical protein
MEQNGIASSGLSGQRASLTQFSRGATCVSGVLGAIEI